MKRQLGLSEMVRRRTARASRRATRGALGLWAWSNAGDLRRARRGRETHAERGRTTGSGDPRRARMTRAERGRRGSTLLIVMALLGMLTLLGMLYFTFASQEQANATNFADAAKRVDDPGDDIDAIFDAALRQLIQGASYDEKNSALWGGRHSLIFNMLGHDLQPFNGPGINVYRPNAGTGSGESLIVDQDRNGAADGDQTLLELNDSPAVRYDGSGNPTLQERNIRGMPAPDVDYTAADHNNAYLAYLGTTWKTTATTATGYSVIKPSFHRPELFRGDDGKPVADWETKGGMGVTASTRGRLFRPHPDHLFVPRAGQNFPAPIRRFLNDFDPADATDIASLPPLRGFPFTKVPPLPGVVPGTPQHRQQGIWSLTATPPAPPFTFPAYEWDVDNDNDGITDSIWMDLDLPVQVRPSDGAAYIPLIAFMVQDLDSLVNLNATGNLSGNTRTAATSNFGNGGDISLSSTGLSSPSEINPLWPLDTLPSEATSLSDHGSYFHPPTTIRHLANMEWWWLNKGRVEFTTPRQIHAGRYGEADRMVGVLTAAGGGRTIGVQISNSNLFPFPGIWDDDDNRDSNEGGPTSTTGVAGGQTKRFRHPLLLNGMGRFSSAASPKQLDLFQALGGTDPNQWLRYTGAGVGYDGNTAGTGNVEWLNPFGGTLMVNPITGVNFAVPGGSPVLFDDPGELTLLSKYLQRPYDEPLDAKEILFLFMSPSDRARVGATSRIEDLMPGNITPNTSNFYQLQVARRLTTESWDVKQFAMARFIGGKGIDGAPGVANQDDNQDGTVDDDIERGWPGSDDDRAWEHNVDLDGNGKLEFPPQFNPPANFQPSQPENAYGAIDPFRPQLRRLLTVEHGNTSSRQTAMRLSINEFLDVEYRPDSTSNPYTDPLAYRPLTPHSEDTTLTTLPAVNPLPTYPPTNEGEKEFWARRDRQQMARDIYVLLYTFCGGNDLDSPTSFANVTTNSGNQVYHAEVRRQMAQFAVNLVDALDRDNVITAFEFDDNLLDGWNLDDDFTTNDVGTLPITSRRFVVFGVEAQELTISEGLWAYQARNPTMDAPLTPFDETTGNHHFLQVELRCVSPTAVDLYDAGSTTLNRSIWRVVRDDNSNGVMDATENAAQFLKGTFVPSMTGPATAPPSSLSPGSLFTFASADASAVGAASLYVDTAAPAGFEMAAPNGVGSFPATPGFADLDMAHSSHSSYVGLEQPTSVAGDLLSRNFEPAAGDTTTSIRLQRRLNPKLIGLNTTNQNPFHSVDRFDLRRQDLNIVVADTNATATTKLAALTSQERNQPLNGGSLANSTGTGTAMPNTLTLKNSNSPGRFTLFQPHFDRDFASVIELFDIPLEDPDLLTRIMVNSRRPPNLVDSSGAGIGQLENGGPFTFGAAVLMQSEDRDSDDVMDASEDANSNGILDMGEDTNTNGRLDFEDFNKNGKLDAHPYHFHRLLSLVEVPTRTHRQQGDPLKVNRVPGKINLNNVRAPQVLASLIDDRQVIGPPERTGADLDTDGTIEPGLQDLLGDTVQDSSGTAIQRDWWFQFLIARDGLDPTTALPLPLSGTSRPFRDLGYLRYDEENGIQSSIEDTILRELPGAIKYSQVGSKGKGAPKGKAKGRTGGGSGTAGPADGRRLFELATDTEFENRSLEPKMRYRLLSKMIGNTTTRSNVFVVHATIGMFACKEYPNGSVRIGGHMDVDGDGSPDTHRAVFIVDRSAVEEAYDKASGTFDWKKLLLAKQRIN